MAAVSTVCPGQVSEDIEGYARDNQEKTQHTISKSPRSGQAGGSGGPDGPYSWFIAALCFLVSLLFSAFFRCGAIFFTYIMAAFDTTRAQASLPLSVYNGFVNLSGLVAGPLIHRFGVRASAVLGGVLMSLGLMMSAFATGVGYLVGSIGVVTGSGHGLLLTCVIVAINEYFEKKRGTALGIDMAGATAASLLFPVIWDYCLEEYGFRATLGLVGALLLNIPAISIFFRKPPWLQTDGSQNYSRSKYDVKGDKEQIAPDKPLLLEVKAPCADRTVDEQSKTFLSKSRRLAVSITPPWKASIFTVTDSAVLSAQSFDSRVSLHAFQTASFHEERCISKTGIVLLNVVDLLDSDQSKYSSLLPKENNATQYSEEANSAVFDRRLTKVHIATVEKDVVRTVFVEPKNGSDHNAGDISDSELTKSSAVGPKNLALESSTLSSHCHDNVASTIGVSWTVPRSSNSTDLLDDSSSVKKGPDSSLVTRAKEVLSMPRFYAHALSYASYTFFLDTFLAVAVDSAVDAGIERSRASHVLTIFSVTDTAGRLLMPLFADYGLVSPLSLLTSSYLLIAAIGLAMPHAFTHLLFWTFVVTLGLPVGYVMVAFSQTLSTEVGLSNLPIAYGFLAGATAIGVFLMPVVIGFYRDSQGSYGGLFRLMGIMVFSSFLLTAWLWFTSARKEPSSAKSVDTTKEAE